MRRLKVAAAFAFLLSVAYGKTSPELSVNLSNGSPLTGQYMVAHGGRGILAFKNIPYAEAPVGNLRFADPVPKAPWTQPLPVQTATIMCPQLDNMVHQTGFVGQEDCLYLNVYKPMNSKSKAPLPVMLYFHGGGWACGTGNEVYYGPDFLLDEDVILVTGNYRLAALGFLTTHSAEFTGNYGIKDQVMMMKWIQQNIAVFGGDPNKVTIFGESAGGASVGYHLQSSMSRGLFHRAIMQSGSPFDVWAKRTPDESIGFAVKMFDALGCNSPPGDYQASLECMRKKDVREIVEALSLYYEWDFHPLVVFTPVVEINSNTPYLTAQDLAATNPGADVPLMIGHNTNEAAFFLAFIARKPELIADFEARFDELISTQLFLFERFDKATMKEKAQAIKDFYFNGENFSWARHQLQLDRLFRDHIFVGGLHEVVKRRINMPSNTFAYLFNYRGATSFTDMILRNSPEEFDFGVSHMDELLYLFPMVKNSINFCVMNNEDMHMRKQMVKMWVRFASTGNPSTKNVQWSPVRQFPIDYLRIGNCNRATCDVNNRLLSQMQSGLFDEHIQFIQDFLEAPIAPAKEEL